MKKKPRIMATTPSTTPNFSMSESQKYQGYPTGKYKKSNIK
jgi:hypothetical protein